MRAPRNAPIMKITLLLDAPDGHMLTAGTVFTLAVRVTNDDGSPAAFIPLQWAAFRQEPVIERRSPVTDSDGIATVEVIASPQPHAKPEPIFVQTPDGRTHLVGTVRCRSEHAVMFCPASPERAAPPPTCGHIAAPDEAISGGAPYRLTIGYPAPNSILPADSEVLVYAQLLDNSGTGISGAKIEVNTSTSRSGSRIEYSPLPITTRADGWAIFWVRCRGLAEKAPDELTGTLTVSCAQYSCSDTKPLTFDTTAGGPGYYSLSLTRLEEDTPRLAGVTYWRRDGSPGKYMPMSVYASSSPGESTGSATTSPRTTFADDFGEALSYVTATAPAGSQVVIYANAAGADTWHSDPYQIASGSYAKSATHYLNPPSSAEPLRSGVVQQLTLEAPNNVSTNQVSWEREPRYAPVKLMPLGSMTAGKAKAEMTGTSTRTAYCAGITGTYYSPQDGAWHMCATAYCFYSGSAPPLDTLRGRISMSIPDGENLSMKDWHTVDVTITQYDGSTPWSNRVVNWTADVLSSTYKDSLFELPHPSTTDRNGKCSVRIRANSDRSFWANIWATSPNPLSGLPDRVLGKAFFNSGIQPIGDPGVITITSLDPLPLTPYVPHSLTASYTHANSGHAFQHKRIIWSAFPSGQFEFSDNPSVTDSNGNTSVTITAVGDDYLGPVTVYARAYNDSTELLDIGNLASLSFQYGMPPPNTAHIALRPVDGDLISDPLLHLVEATYRLNEGAALAEQPIQWTVEPAGSIALQTNGPTMTDENGVAVNAFSCEPGAFVIATVTARAINPYTLQPDTSTMLVAIKDGRLVAVESQGNVSLAPPTVPAYQEGVSYPLRATYQQPDGLPFPERDIYWAVYPQDRFNFLWRNPTKTDLNGDSTNDITCTTGSDVAALVSASSPNYFTGSYDFAQRSMRFVDPINVPGLRGIMLDKPSAHNPPILSGVDPSNPDQVVTGQILLSGRDRTGKDVLIWTDPDGADIAMYGQDNLPLKTQSTTQGTAFVAKTDSGGVATFKAGSMNLQLLSLQATYGTPSGGTFSTHSAQVSIAPSDDSLAQSNLPEVQLNGVFNPMPSDTPTFQAHISDAWDIVSGTDLVSVILNGVVVYYGPASQFFEGVDIAYALLRTSNAICYLRQRGTSTIERIRKVFRASGTAQTGPLMGVSRTLPAPGIIGSTPIGPKDIVAGLGVMIPPYKNVTPGDVISLFVYLSGKYSLTARPINNIATLSYTVTAGDALMRGKPMKLVLPQVHIAGYGAPGALQADYRVTSASGPMSQWSLGTAPIKLDTTLEARHPVMRERK